jgi:hypothetical protein
MSPFLRMRIVAQNNCTDQQPQAIRDLVYVVPIIICNSLEMVDGGYVARKENVPQAFHLIRSHVTVSSSKLVLARKQRDMHSMARCTSCLADLLSLRDTTVFVRVIVLCVPVATRLWHCFLAFPVSSSTMMPLQFRPKIMNCVVSLRYCMQQRHQGNQTCGCG